MAKEHPARAASHRSMAAVKAHDKAAWLALFAEDACIEDPIGKSPIDPTGEGIRGSEAIEAFWEKNVAPNAYEFEVHESFAAGLEVANVLTLHVTLKQAKMQAKVHGVFTYRVNEAGKIRNLRGFWEMASMMATMKPLDTG